MTVYSLKTEILGLMFMFQMKTPLVSGCSEAKIIMVSFDINNVSHQCLYMYEDQKRFGAMLDIQRSAGVTPEVNMRSPLHAGEQVLKSMIHPGFETQGRHHQKSKTGVSLAPQSGLMSSQKNQTCTTLIKGTLF